jgi:hypothetical protein
MGHQRNDYIALDEPVSDEIRGRLIINPVDFREHLTNPFR